MIIHPAISVLFIVKECDANLEPLFSYLQLFPGFQLTIRAQMPEDIKPYDVIVTVNSGDAVKVHGRLEQFVRAGGGWLEMVHLSDSALPQIFGVRPTPVGPCTELRVMFQDSDHPLAARWMLPVPQL